MTASGARATSSARARSAMASRRATSRRIASALSAVSRAIALMRSAMSVSLAVLRAQFARFGDKIVAVAPIGRAREFDRRTARQKAAPLDAQHGRAGRDRQQLRLLGGGE